ncbi:hypothetical protein JHK82_017267 [Glycine max]|nr:hypothetical protein JHK82_017267 [Glycine max]
MASALFRVIAALGRNLVVASTCGYFALVVLFALGGFVLSIKDMKSWWIWGYWISPLMYEQNTIMVNEFLGNNWNRNPLKNSLVGLPVNGLLTEQRKRLTIAVELVANPSIIFMDEPTSGLDARAAAIVMRTVRNTVDTGRTVVCTIHQPSIDIFEAFDEHGGQEMYVVPLGPHSSQLVKYFESIPVWWRWFYRICPVAWTIYGLVASQFGDITNVMKSENESVQEFIRSYFGFKHDFIGVCAIMVSGFVVLFLLIFAVSIKPFFNFQRR